MILTNCTYISSDLSIKNGDIEIKDGKIVQISEKIEKKGEQEIFDCSNYHLSPGFINTHTHIPMTLMKGIADHLPLNEWLEKVIFPVEERFISPEFVKMGAILGAVEMVKTGTTSIVDMYYNSIDIADALETVGLRGFLGIGPGSLKNGDSDKFFDKIKDSKLINGSMFAHAIYTTSEKDILNIKEFADKKGISYQFHLLETEIENINFKKEKNIDLIPYLDHIGFLSDRLIAAHGVWIEEKDIDILKNRGVTIAHNPHSNLKLNSGIAPIKNLIDQSVNITLGTDGSASNNHLNMMLEMDLAAKLYYFKSKQPIHPSVIFNMGTKNGAKPLNLNQKIGEIKVGAYADIIFFNKKDGSMLPDISPISHIVFANPESAIDNVLINGEWVLKDKKFVKFDIELFYNELNSFLKNIPLKNYYQK